ncbi:MAG: biliverdin-producing heme oxygenase [Gemmataceae bacterium]
MILNRLKRETDALHRQAEAAMDLPSRLASRAAYADMLGRMLGFYAPLEAKLAQTPLFETLGLDGDERAKTSLIRADLAHLGWPSDRIDALPRCTSSPDVGDIPQALGAMYVLEGATLGGRYIRQQVGQTLGIGDEDGASFFACYGPRTGAMWTAFGETVTAYAYANPDCQDAIVASASETFRQFEAWMSEKERP